MEEYPELIIQAKYTHSHQLEI